MHFSMQYLRAQYISVTYFVKTLTIFCYQICKYLNKFCHRQASVINLYVISITANTIRIGFRLATSTLQEPKKPAFSKQTKYGTYIAFNITKQYLFLHRESS